MNKKPESFERIDFIKINLKKSQKPNGILF
jgi:hypothetical protein